MLSKAFSGFEVGIYYPHSVHSVFFIYSNTDKTHSNNMEDKSRFPAITCLQRPKLKEVDKELVI